MVSGIKTTGLITGFGTAAGALFGFGIGGPGTAAAGAKLGAALGVQVAIANKAEEGVDALGKKTIQGADAVANQVKDLCDGTGKLFEKGITAAGQEVQVLAKNANTAIDKVCTVSIRIIEEFADKLSRMVLIGYSMTIVQSASGVNLKFYNENCPSVYDNINCVPIFLTSTSLQLCTILIGCCFLRASCDLVFKKGQ